MKKQRLNCIIMSVPFHYYGRSYLVFDMQGKLLGRLRFTAGAGWVGTGSHYNDTPLFETIEGALKSLLAMEHNATPGNIFRMKSEEWKVQAKPGAKFQEVKAFYDAKDKDLSL